MTPEAVSPAALGGPVAPPPAPPLLRRIDNVPLAGGIGIAAVGVLLMVAVGGSYDGLSVAVGLGYAVAVVGMVVQIGHSHQLAFTQSAFMGAGGYGIGLLETHYGWGTAASIVVVVVLSGVVALILGSVVTRAPGLSLALATLLIVLLLSQLTTFSNYLGSFSGISGINELWNAPDYQQTLVLSGVVAAIILGLAAYVAWRLMRSNLGFQLAVLAEDEAMAQSLGINVRQRKLELFVFSSVLAAVGGALVGSLQGTVSPDIIGLPTELTLQVMLFIGGRRSIPAAVIGAVAIEWLSTRSTTVTSNLTIIDGVLLLAVLLFQPEGLAGLAGDAFKFVRRNHEHPAA